MDCIFCKIINKEIKAEVVYEDQEIFVFRDIHPLAPVHLLIIPKRHIPTIVDIQEGDIELMGKMIYRARLLADQFNLSDNGYKLLLRVKKHGGQEVDHIHLHLIGGAPLHEDIHALIEEKK